MEKLIKDMAEFRSELVGLKLKIEIEDCIRDCEDIMLTYDLLDSVEATRNPEYFDGFIAGFVEGYALFLGHLKARDAFIKEARKEFRARHGLDLTNP